MKKGFCLFFSIYFCILCSCNKISESHISYEPASNSIATTISSSAHENIPLLYQKVTNGEQRFVFNDDEILLSEYVSPYLQEPFMLSNEKSFAICDMDGDGSVEFLLKGWSDDILVLHIEDGIVYGYDFVFRNMYNVTADGAYFWNTDQGNSMGCSRLTFDKKICQQINLYRTEQDSNDITKYYIANNEVTIAQYESYINELPSTAPLLWYDFYEIST